MLHRDLTEVAQQFSGRDEKRGLNEPMLPWSIRASRTLCASQEVRVDSLTEEDDTERRRSAHEYTGRPALECEDGRGGRSEILRQAGIESWMEVQVSVWTAWQSRYWFRRPVRAGARDCLTADSAGNRRASRMQSGLRASYVSSCGAEDPILGRRRSCEFRGVARDAEDGQIR